MKKTLALILALVLCFSLLTACGNPVADEFEKFVNEDMTEVNAKADEIAAELQNLETYTTDAEWVNSMENILLPKTDEVLTLLANINPTTEEVSALKAKYVSAMEAFKESFTLVLEAFRTADEAKLTAGNEKITEANALLEEYGTARQELADEFGFTFE